MTDDDFKRVCDIAERDDTRQKWLDRLPEASHILFPNSIALHIDRHFLIQQIAQIGIEILPSIARLVDETPDMYFTDKTRTEVKGLFALLTPDQQAFARDPVRVTAQRLIDDVKRRHPGEELTCPLMRALDGALQIS